MEKIPARGELSGQVDRRGGPVSALFALSQSLESLHSEVGGRSPRDGS